MNGVTTAFWGLVINNYDETDLAMIQNGYPDHMRELVYTLEKGEQGTPHIQGYIKLQRQQRLSFVKKLFPRGNFKALTSDEYMRNAKAYAQKLDGTAQSPAIHTFNDPMNTIESVMKKVINHMINEYSDCEDLLLARKASESDMVRGDYKFAKIFVSTVYTAMWKKFGHEMYQCVFIQHTHTHTHKDELFSQEITIPTINAAQGDTPSGSEYTEGSSEGEDFHSEDNEDSASETDEGSDEGSDDQFSSEDD